MRRLVTFASFAWLAACSGSSSNKNPMPDAAKDVGFNKPTAVLHANTQPTGASVPMDLGVADLSCLGKPSSDQATTVAVTLNAVIADFQSHNAVPNATVTAFEGTSYTAPFDTKTSDSMGNVTFTIPTGKKRIGFKMSTTDGSTMPTFLLNQYYDPAAAVQPAGTCTPAPCRDRVQSVSTSTATLLPALIGETRTPSTGVLAGALRDCSKHEISNFIATVSSTSGTPTPLPGTEAYYFSPGVDLPVHHPAAGGAGDGTTLDMSSGNGLFMAIQLPATATAYVQVWGFVTDADLASGTLKLIAELPAPVLADTVITGSLEPLRQ
jgi:hypothetical protein